MLNCKQLTKRFGGVTALAPFDLDVQPDFLQYFTYDRFRRRFASLHASGNRAPMSSPRERICSPYQQVATVGTAEECAYGKGDGATWDSFLHEASVPTTEREGGVADLRLKNGSV